MNKDMELFWLNISSTERTKFKIAKHDWFIYATLIISVTFINLTLCFVLSCSGMSNSLQPSKLYPTRLLCPQDSLGKNTGEGHHCLLQGIIPTQGSNPNPLCLLHWEVNSLPLSHLECPRFHVEFTSKMLGVLQLYK